MRVKLTIYGCGEVEIEGNPREVLEKADVIVVEWKVRCDGKEKG